MIIKSALFVFITLLFTLIIVGTTFATNSTIYMDMQSETDSCDGSQDYPVHTINYASVDKSTSQNTYSTSISSTNGPPGNEYSAATFENDSNLIQPSDLTYMGAFRLPDTPGGMGWEWAGVEMGALTYYSSGDSGGRSDGYPGSLYGTGHDQLKYISEINIPVPVISPDKNPDDLNTAQTLQEFTNVLGDKLEGMELPKVGLAYLDKQGSQTTGKLYYCFGQHIQDEQKNPSHGWFELNLSNLQLAGDWKIENYLNYLTTYYIFSISKEWADTYTPGKYLVTGRFRDGGQGSQGPTLFAYGPWNEGNPAIPGTQLSTKPLLQYSSVTDPESNVMNNYAHSDEWNGGSWLTSNGRSAVIFAGTKGIGNTWYGFSNGTVWPTSGGGPFPPLPVINPTFYGEDLRGWWSDSFQAQILFYDPEDLAAVAQGIKQPYEPQPYATLNIDPYLFNLQDSQQKDRVGAVAFDSVRGILYVTEPLADGDKTIIHVWKLKSSADIVPPNVVAMDPANTALNVPRDKIITINFNEPIKAGTMWIELYNTTGTKTPIPITTTINGNVLTINHTALLSNGTKYTLALHTGSITDLAGNNLAGVARYFTTSTDAKAPTITSTDPTNNAVNVARNKAITITFNEPIKAGTMWIELYNTTGTKTPIPITTTINGNVLTINHSTLLANGIKYTLAFHTGSITDLAGNNLAGVARYFTTSTDTTAPTITSTDPINNAVNVARNKAITITFNEPIKAGTMWIELYNTTGTKTPIPITTTISGNFLTINHSTLLANGTKYILCLHTGCLTDLTGNSLVGVSSYFTTGNT